MTRRDYVLLTEALRDARFAAVGIHRGGDTVSGVDVAARFIAEALTKRSRGFDAERFLDGTGTQPVAACGPPGGHRGCGCAECVTEGGGE